MNINLDLSLANLLARAQNNTAQTLHLQWLIACTASDRVQVIRGAIDYIASEFTKTSILKQNLSEDQLTLWIVDMIKSMGIEARHDTFINGHCDITIEASENFVWLAEAKKHRDYKWIQQGYIQLTRRYSSGLSGQNHGDLIVYVFNQDCRAVLENWIIHLSHQFDGIIYENINKDELYIITKEKHMSSGLYYFVRHKFFVLHHSAAGS